MFSKESLSYRGKDFFYEEYDLSAQGWANYEKVLPLLKSVLLKVRDSWR